MTSSGSLVAGDGGVVEVFGEERPERAPRILARLLYQTRIASNLIAVVNSNQVVRTSNEVNQDYLIMRMSESSSTTLSQAVVSGDRWPQRSTRASPADDQT